VNAPHPDTRHRAHPGARRRTRRWALPAATATALAVGSLALLPGSASAKSADLTYSCTYGTLVSGAVPTTVTIDTDAPDTTPLLAPLQVLTTTTFEVPDSVHSALSAAGASAVQLVADQTTNHGVTVSYDYGSSSTPVQTHPVFHFSDWVFTGTSGGAYSMNPGPKIPGTYQVHAGDISLELQVTTASGTTTYPVSCTVPSGQLVDQIVATDSTTTALALSSSTATYGGTAPTATATVTRDGTPTSNWPALGGKVQFSDGSTVLGTAPVNASGVATYSLAALKSGQHSITAAYVPATTGDPYLSSTSSASVLKISSPTTTTVTAPQSVLRNDTSTATATVTATDGTTPTGSVSFAVDGGSPTSKTLSGGTATFTLPTGTPGTHSVTASYGGATYLVTSSGSKEYGVGAPTDTTVALTASTWAHNDDSPRATATVTAPGSDGTWPAITGTVQFKADGTSIGAPVEVGTDGKATLAQLGDLSLGTHTITAEYTPASGSVYALSTSGAQDLKVTSHTVTSLTVPSVVGIDQKGWTATAKVTSDHTGPAVTGAVTFTVDGVVQTPVDIDANGTAVSAALPTGKAGPHTIAAVYSGDDLHVTSTAKPETYQVGAAATRTTLTMPGSAKYGMRSVARATVRSNKGVPAGKVTFEVVGAGGRRSIVAVVKKGVAAATLPVLAPGAYQVSAAFSPTSPALYHSSGAAAKWLRVSKDTSRTTSWVRGVKLHQRPTAHVTVRGAHGAAKGKVLIQLRRYGKVMQVRTPTLRNGKAVVTFWKIGQAGRWAVVATYTGSADHTRSTVTKTVIVKAKPANHKKH